LVENRRKNPTHPHLARSFGVTPCEFFDESYLARNESDGALRRCTFHDPAFAVLGTFVGTSTRGPAYSWVHCQHVQHYTLGHGAPRLACLRTPAILSALSRLSWRAYARLLRAYACRPCYARHTFSGLAALCRTPRRKLIGRPVPEIWPNLVRTDRQTD